MKFSCTQENLLRALGTVSMVANKNAVLPILSHVLIRAEDNILTLIATNLEVGVKCVVRGKIDEPGEYTIPAKLLFDYVSCLPKEKIDAILHDGELEIMCGAHSTKIKGLPSSDFPILPTVENPSLVEMNPLHLLAAFDQVTPSIAGNEARPELSGVLFKFDVQNSNLVLVGTDSYRLSEKKIVYTSPQGALDGDTKVIVPLRTVHEFGRVLGQYTKSEEGLVRVSLSTNQILFEFAGVELVSRVIEGNFPDYQQIIPGQFSTVIECDKAELQKLIKASSLFSRMGVNDILLRVVSQEKQLAVESINSQIGEYKASVAVAKIEGGDQEVIFNYKFTLDGLNALDGSLARFQIVDGASPCVLTSPTAQDFRYLLMPIKQ